ncbi:MAG: sporulation protein YtxC [Syntrophomonadales bacterium]
MIYSLDLVMQNGEEYIRERLETSFYWLKERGFHLTVQVYPGEPFRIIQLTLSGSTHNGVFHDDDIIYIFKHQLAEILAEAILNHWEKKLIRRQAERNYKRLPSAEQAELAERAVHFLRRCNDNESLNLLLKFGRKNKISHNILEHLDTDNTLNLDGLVNFSLREYLREIRFAVDLAYEDLKSEKQYNDFIRLLKYFVETQPPKAVEVNIYLAENGAFHLWDEKGHVIEQDLIDLYLEDILTNDNNLDDILISILITVAPRRIIFHSLGAVPDTEPARIIKRVFKERIMVCPGCDRCLGHQLRDR